MNKKQRVDVRYADGEVKSWNVDSAIFLDENHRRVLMVDDGVSYMMHVGDNDCVMIIQARVEK